MSILEKLICNDLEGMKSFMIYNFMTHVKQSGKTFEQLFEILDKNNSGSLEYDEFIKGL